MKIYHADRRLNGNEVFFSGPFEIAGKNNLSPRASQEFVNHSPDGFNWGYEGSGPSQLAFAILQDVTGSATVAKLFYQEFKREIIAVLPDSWSLHEMQIHEWIREKSKGVR